MLSRALYRWFLIALLIGVLISSSCMLCRRLFASSLPSYLGAHVRMSGKPPVIVVGSGLAGLAAAHEALASGAGVHMLDRAPKPGGNSMKASSGINGAGTRFQRQLGINKDESFLADSIRSAGARYREWEAQGKAGAADRGTLVSMLADQSESAVNWLVDDIGVDLSVVAPLGGHSVPRTHRGVGNTPPGAAIVTTLLRKLQENPRFQLSNSAEVTAVEITDSAVTGVKYTLDGQEHALQGPVVFAAGGFAGDATGLLAEHRPDLTGLPSTNDARPGAHGILAAAGAALVDMDSVQVHPTGFVDPKDPTAAYKFLAAEALRGEGGILFSAEGKRFVNELDQRDVVSKAIMDLQAPAGGGATRMWDVTLLLDPGACEAVAGHLSFYLFKGFMCKKKVGELEPALIAAVDRYAAQVARGRDDDFGRNLFGRWQLPPGDTNRNEEVCVGKVTPIVHFTMGGVAFNAQAEVLTADGVPIAGLWAAGEITGGIHGDNRLGGSSLLECVVFGRIAGNEAAKHASV
jgi:FAD-dependent fumarate reductase